MVFMKYVVDIKLLMRRNLPILVGIALFFYFSYHAIYGERSFTQMYVLEDSVHSKGMVLRALEKEHVLLEEKVAMMRPQTLSIDLAEEQIRAVLGYRYNGEIVVISD